MPDMDLDDRIARNQKALDRHPPGNVGRPGALFLLASSMHDRYLERGEVTDLDEAIALHRSALDLRLPGHLGTSHTSFQAIALCLSRRYDNQATMPDLEEAIVLGRTALDLRPLGQSGRTVILISLAKYLKVRFLQLGAIADLDEAIALYRSALALGSADHSNRVHVLHQLAFCLWNRWSKQATMPDLDEAITLGRAALDLCPPSHSGRAVALNNLARYLSPRFAKLGANTDLDEAIELHRAVLDLRPAGHSDRSYSLHQLALCLWCRYSKQATMSDLDEAIVLGRAALELYPPDHPHRAATLNSLADHLGDRFLKLGADADLDEIIVLYRSLFVYHPPGHPNRSYALHNLAFYLWKRYRKQATIPDLDEAIILGRVTLENSPSGHPHRIAVFNNLADYLKYRFLRLGTDADLNEAILLYRSALNFHPAGHSDRLTLLNTLVSCLSSRLEKQQTEADLDEFISLNRNISDLQFMGHPEHSTFLERLFRLRKRLQKSDLVDKLDEYISREEQTEPLPPTIEGILQQCPRFRVLVIGKSGVGKSTLINYTFGVKDPFAEHDKRGLADITKELISEKNSRLILHDCKGFEQEDDDTLAIVTQFIKERRNNQDIKEQIHAVWLCFHIPNTEAGQRMMETEMEEFLQQKKGILGDVPTIFVFTKYDVLITEIEFRLCQSEKDFSPAVVEPEAKQLLEMRCIQPIQQLAKETNIPHIAVSMGHRDKLEALIELTYEKVSEYFRNQPGTATVPTVAVIAQRVAPDLKIEELIKVGKERYWRAIFTGRVFFGRSMQDCLQVIHDDIIGVWNFRDDDKLLLSKEFREFMINLVNLLDHPSDCPPSPPRSETMSSIQKEGFPLVSFLMFALPFAAGLKLVKWAHNVYQQTPEVQRNFIAYIVDLTNVLDILFTLTPRRYEELKLNIRAIKAAYKAYFGSTRRTHVHAQIRGCPPSVFASSGVISVIETLVRQRYDTDKELAKRIRDVSAKYLEGEEPWYP